MRVQPNHQAAAAHVHAAWLAPAAVAVVSGGIGAITVQMGLSARQGLAAAFCLAAMALWATAALSEAATALAFFAAATVSGVAAPATIFSGFASSAFWLVLGGMILAQAMAQTGLGGRLARAVSRPLAGSYRKLIAGTLVITFALAFLMPSNMGRIALLMPIMLALADELGLAPGRPGRTGVVLAVGFGTFLLSTSILPANVPNLVMAGSAETLFGIHIDYVQYLVLHAPVLALAKGMLLTFLICRLFPDQVSTAVAPPVPATSLSGSERRLVAILAVTLMLWIAAPLHGIAPAWIGLAAALACLLPGIGVVPADVYNQINHRTLLYVAALLGVVAVINDIGLGTLLARGLQSALPLAAGAPAVNFAALTLLSVAISLVASANAVGAIYTPMAQSLSVATGFDLTTVIMIQVIGFSTVLLPKLGPR
jgi:di/tricarboxylate transporter